MAYSRLHMGNQGPAASVPSLLAACRAACSVLWPGIAGRASGLSYLFPTRGAATQPKALRPEAGFRSPRSFAPQGEIPDADPVPAGTLSLLLTSNTEAARQFQERWSGVGGDVIPCYGMRFVMDCLAVNADEIAQVVVDRNAFGAEDIHVLRSAVAEAGLSIPVVETTGTIAPCGTVA